MSLQIEPNEKVESLLTRAEVADFLAVSPATIRRWERNGLIKATAINPRTVRYRREEVDALINSGK